MAEVGRVSIRLPSNIRQGDVIRIRSLVIHPMELVQRDKQGDLIQEKLQLHPRDAGKIQRQRGDAGGDDSSDEPESHLYFPFKVERPGRLTVTFSDTTGKSYEGNAEIKFS